MSTFATAKADLILPAPSQEPGSQGGGAALPEKIRFAGIDGLRGVACLMVLGLHSWSAFGEHNWPNLNVGRLDLGPHRLFSRGYGGVDLFFVLSGFCLSFPILSRPQRAVRWDRYAVARIRRIVPPYWAALFLFAALSLVVRHYNLWAQFGGDLRWPGIKRFVVQGLLFGKGILVGSFWTLVIEWRWYFLFPLCIWLWRRIGGWGVLVASFAACVVSLALKFGFHMNWAVSWAEGLFRYMPLFAFGILAAELAVNGGNCACEKFLVRYSQWGLLLCAAIVLAVPAGDQDTWQSTAQRLLTWGPLAFFATLAAVRDKKVERILSWQPLVGVGIFSYSLYLLHEPLIWVTGTILSTHFSSRPVLLLLYVVVGPLAMILLAYLFFLAFERPFLSRKPHRPATATLPATRHPDAGEP